MKVKDRARRMERGRGEDMVDGHQNPFQMTLSGAFKWPVLSDHKSNNVRQKRTV